jgi:hypothetical protein
MPIGKLSPKKPLGDFLTQDIDVSQLVNIKPSLDSEEIIYTGPEAEQLINSILKKANIASQYNNLTDSKILLDTPSVPATKEEVIALKQSNRATVKKLLEEMRQYEARIQSKVEDSNYYVKYDEDNLDFISLTRFLFPNHTTGRLSYKEVEEVKRRRQRVSRIQVQKQINKNNRKLNQPTVEIDKEFEDVIDDAVRYEENLFQKMNFNVSVPVNVAATKTEDWRNSKNKGISLFHFNFSYPRTIIELDGDLSENEKELNEDDITENTGLVPALRETQNMKAKMEFLESTFAKVDNENNFIDTIFANKEPLRVKGRKQKIELVSWEYIENCYQCFFDIKNAFGLSFDFNISGKFEFDYCNILKRLADDWEMLKAALDLPYLLQQNLCSLARLGLLCPIELLYIIASITGVIIYTWREIFSDQFGLGFLQDLVVTGILDPIIGSLEYGLRVGLLPSIGYVGCVSKSLVSLQDVTNISGGAFKRIEDVYNDVINGGNEVLGYPKTEVLDWLSKAQNSLDTISPLINPSVTKLFQNDLDIIELVKAVVSTHGNQNSDLYKKVAGAKEALEGWMSNHRKSRIELIAKIMALGTLLTIVWGLFSIWNKGFDVCAKVPMPDGTIETVSPFSYGELKNMLQLEDLQVYRQAVSDTKSELVNSDQFIEDRDAFLYNPITDRRFSLVNCDKARSSLVSKGVDLEIFKKILLGAEIVNV